MKKQILFGFFTAGIITIIGFIPDSFATKVSELRKNFEKGTEIQSKPQSSLPATAATAAKAQTVKKQMAQLRPAIVAAQQKDAIPEKTVSATSEPSAKNSISDRIARFGGGKGIAAREAEPSIVSKKPAPIIAKKKGEVSRLASIYDGAQAVAPTSSTASGRTTRPEFTRMPFSGSPEEYLLITWDRSESLSTISTNELINGIMDSMNFGLYDDVLRLGEELFDEDGHLKARHAALTGHPFESLVRVNFTSVLFFNKSTFKPEYLIPEFLEKNIDNIKDGIAKIKKDLRILGVKNCDFFLDLAEGYCIGKKSGH